MAVPLNKATGSIAKYSPPEGPGPIKLSNAKRAQIGLKPNPSSAQATKTAATNKSVSKK